MEKLSTKVVRGTYSKAWDFGKKLEKFLQSLVRLGQSGWVVYFVKWETLVRDREKKEKKKEMRQDFWKIS